jgi:TRAP-type C4-dicarboxylate transport system permease small subunit
VLALAVAAVFIACIAIVSTADVIGTAFFSTPVPSALELSEAALVMVVFMGLAFAQQRGAHITVDIFSARFTGVARYLSIGLALAAAAFFFGFIAWRGGIAAWESISIDERSEGLTRLPLYPGKMVLTLGCAVAMLESLRQLVHLCLGRPEPEAKRSA